MGVFRLTGVEGLPTHGWVWADGSSGWFCCFLSLEGLIQRTRRRRSYMRTEIDDDQSQCSTILRHSTNPPLFRTFLSLTAFMMGGWGQNMKTGDESATKRAWMLWRETLLRGEGFKKIWGLPHRSQTHRQKSFSVNEGFESRNLSSMRTRMAFINCGGNAIKAGNLGKERRLSEFGNKSNEGNICH
jgi:hypothetical protein